jgi:hypothetical protein
LSQQLGNPRNLFRNAKPFVKKGRKTDGSSSAKMAGLPKDSVPGHPAIEISGMGIEAKEVVRLMVIQVHAKEMST